MKYVILLFVPLLILHVGDAQTYTTIENINYAVGEATDQKADKKGKVELAPNSTHPVVPCLS